MSNIRRRIDTLDELPTGDTDGSASIWRQIQQFPRLDALARRLLSTPSVKLQLLSGPGETAGVLVGSSNAARELRQDVALAAQAAVRVMIVGEPGVGKRRLAKLIHRHGAASGAPFVRAQCDSLAPSD